MPIQWVTLRALSRVQQGEKLSKNPCVFTNTHTHTYIPMHVWIYIAVYGHAIHIYTSNVSCISMVELQICNNIMYSLLWILYIAHVIYYNIYIYIHISIRYNQTHCFNKPLAMVKGSIRTFEVPCLEGEQQMCNFPVSREQRSFIPSL